MNNKCHHPIKRRYKKLAAALAGAAVMSAALLHGLPAGTQTATDVKTDNKPVAAQEEQSPAPNGPPQNTPPEVKGNVAKELDITATAYAPGPHDNEQWGNKTHMGTQVRPGVIAVDPRIIPLGSRVLIKYPDGSTQYAVAEDTGGAIKGHRIDVAKWTVSEARSFGIKPVKVYVLNNTNNDQYQGHA